MVPTVGHFATDKSLCEMKDTLLLPNRTRRLFTCVCYPQPVPKHRL